MLFIVHLARISTSTQQGYFVCGYFWIFQLSSRTDPILMGKDLDGVFATVYAMYNTFISPAEKYFVKRLPVAAMQ